MLAAERKQEILRYVLDKNSATIKDLSDYFGVHDATIRRDLSELEKNQSIKRTHGGVILIEEEVHSEPHFEKRKDSFSEEKKRIGMKAASFIHEGDTIILDSGTTTAHIAEALKNRKNITVITNDIHIASLLRHSPLKVIVTGGILYPNNNILNGDITNQSLENLNVKKAFIGTPALHHERGLTHFDDRLIAAKMKMIQAAKKLFVVADHHKMNKVSLHTFAKTTEVDYLITDSKIHQTQEQKLKDNFLNVVVV